MTFNSKHYIVKISAYSAIEASFIDLNSFHHALINDPDLASVPRTCLANILQTLFICTGCDYVSFFKKVGKATFFNYFFQHARFICSGNVGSLYETTATVRSNGFLAFLRLVGTVYFKKHLPSFVSLYGHETPDQSLNSIDQTLDPHARHKLWFERIREVVSDRIQCEEERVPSCTSLWRHWMRSCWISTMWAHSHTDDLYRNLPSPHLNGWLLSEEGFYSIDWEDEKVKSEIENSISTLLKGCKCKTKCGVRCGCRKKQTSCGPGCECQDCENLPVQHPANSGDDNETDTISETELESDELESDEEDTSDVCRGS
uniref:Tesmin/TSO1-like CXC domain-containing protein n=1 Tax=Amphimedon queenslandica TaxID=400682 RepID=A0A1X7SK26_AMPQE